MVGKEMAATQTCTGTDSFCVDEYSSLIVFCWLACKIPVAAYQMGL